MEDKVGKVYKNQTALAIRRRTEVDLTYITAVYLKYIKPDGTTGQWTGTVYNASRGIVEYTIVSANDLDQSGTWTIWAYVTFANGNSAPGEPTKLEVYDEGQ